MKTKQLFPGFLLILLALVTVIYLNGGRLHLSSPQSATHFITDNSSPTGGQHLPGAANSTSPSAFSPPASKMSSDFVVGGRRWKLNFADQTLPLATQQRIYYDLNLNFGHFQKFEVKPLRKPMGLADGRRLDRIVWFDNDNRRLNRVFSDAPEFGCLFEGDVSALFVPQAITDAYRKALDFEEQNKVAFEKLDSFLERMNQIREHPIQNFQDLLIWADDKMAAEADFSKISPAEFARAWGEKTYRAASVLDITSTEGRHIEGYGSLVAETYIVSPDKLTELFPIVFRDGQWRFLILRPPT